MIADYGLRIEIRTRTSSALLVISVNPHSAIGYPPQRVNPQWSADGARLALLLFPLVGFAVNALLGAWLPRRAYGWIATAMMLGAFIVAWIVLDRSARAATRSSNIAI